MFDNTQDQEQPRTEGRKAALPQSRVQRAPRIKKGERAAPYLERNAPIRSENQEKLIQLNMEFVTPVISASVHGIPMAVDEAYIKLLEAAHFRVVRRTTPVPISPTASWREAGRGLVVEKVSAEVVQDAPAVADTELFVVGEAGAPRDGRFGWHERVAATFDVPHVRHLASAARAMFTLASYGRRDGWRAHGEQELMPFLKDAGAVALMEVARAFISSSREVRIRSHFPSLARFPMGYVLAVFWWGETMGGQMTHRSRAFFGILGGAPAKICPQIGLQDKKRIENYATDINRHISRCQREGMTGIEAAQNVFLKLLLVAVERFVRGLGREKGWLDNVEKMAFSDIMATFPHPE